MRSSRKEPERNLNDMNRIQSGVAASKNNPDEDVIDIGALVSTLWRGKYIIAIAIFFAIALAIFYAYFVATPTYRSTAVVMLNSREEQVVDRGNVIGALGSDGAVIRTEVEILSSRLLLGKVVDELQLTQDPEFNRHIRPPGRLDIFKDFLKGIVLGRTDSPSANAGESKQRESTISTLLESLTIVNIPSSLVFDVTVETTNANKSANIADALVNLYILNQLEVKFEATEQATSWLTERVTDLQVSLESAEEAVKNFRASTPLISTEALEGLEVQVKDTRDRIENMETAKSNMLTRLDALRSAQTHQQKAEVSNDLQLQRMLPRVDNPEVSQSFDARFQQILLRAQNDLARNTSQLSALKTSLEELERQASQQSQDLITLRQLTREAEASRLLYEYFLSRLKETSAQQGIQQADSRILSPALVPSGAASPRRALILALSSVLGLIIGAAIVLIRETRNRAFRTAEQLEGATGYATIGQLPLIKSKRRKDAITYLRDRPSSAAAEAVRNLRTSVMLSNVDTPPKVIMTCSALPGEGKTTVAMSLTLNFASMGKKVLLIEGDIRRRVFGQYLTTEQTDGVVSVLTGARTFDEVVTHDELVGADVLLGDKGQSNAADIFSSTRFAELLKELRGRYDTIIVDTPPVLVVPDARVIAQHVDATVFVVKWDQTQRDQVISALREFESVGKPVSGLVLNQISPRGMKRYGYGNNYGPYSAYGAKYYLN